MIPTFQKQIAAGGPVKVTHLCFVSPPLTLDEVRRALQELTADMYQIEPGQLKLRIKKAVPEYQPFLS